MALHITVSVAPAQVPVKTTFVIVFCPGPSPVGLIARFVEQDVSLVPAVGMTQVPPSATADDAGGSVCSAPGVGAAEGRDGEADVVGVAPAEATAAEGEVGAATHAATTTRTARTPSIAMARTFIVASFEHGGGAARGRALCAAEGRTDGTGCCADRVDAVQATRLWPLPRSAAG